MINTTNTISLQDAYLIGNTIGVDWNQIDIEQFRRGIEVELEHGLVDPSSNVTNDDLFITGKIAWAHLNELSDYYTRLDMIESFNMNTSLVNKQQTKTNSVVNFLAGATVGVGAILLAKYLKDKKTNK